LRFTRSASEPSVCRNRRVRRDVNTSWCVHQNRLDVRIASAHGGNDCPRYIGDDNANGADGDVD
jgi:hypothetical protein